MCLLSTVTSVSRCNTLLRPFGRCIEVPRLPRSFIELPRNRIKLSLRVARQVIALGEVLAEQTVGIVV